MPEPTTILVETQADAATITLNRPDALNAITPTMLDELHDAVLAVGADPATRVIVLTGAGSAFSSGVDLKALQGMSLEGGSVGDVLDLPARRLIDAIAIAPQVVVAKVNGFCFTGALELALACDLIVVAEEAKLADTHAKFGLRPTWGLSQRLPRAVGIRRARHLSYTARTFTGREAADWGLATFAVPATDLDRATDELVATIVANSSGSIAAYKDLYRVAQDETLDAGLVTEAQRTFPIDDTEERLAEFR